VGHHQTYVGEFVIPKTLKVCRPNTPVVVNIHFMKWRHVCRRDLISNVVFKCCLAARRNANTKYKKNLYSNHGSAKLASSRFQNVLCSNNAIYFGNLSLIVHRDIMTIMTYSIWFRRFWIDFEYGHFTSYHISIE